MIFGFGVYYLWCMFLSSCFGDQGYFVLSLDVTVSVVSYLVLGGGLILLNISSLIV